MCAPSSSVHWKWQIRIACWVNLGNVHMPSYQNPVHHPVHHCHSCHSPCCLSLMTSSFLHPSSPWRPFFKLLHVQLDGMAVPLSLCRTCKSGFCILLFTLQVNTSVLSRSAFKFLRSICIDLEAYRGRCTSSMLLQPHFQIILIQLVVEGAILHYRSDNLSGVLGVFSELATCLFTRCTPLP
jgi:hypothetical protein